jgi:predicted AAA+ superfamily ATPase
MSGEFELYYWREASREVDFVLRRGQETLAIEVKAGNHRTSLPGMAAFEKAFGRTKKLLVGTGGIPIEEFLRTSPSVLVR